MEEREGREGRVTPPLLSGASSPMIESVSSSPLSVLSKSPSPPSEDAKLSRPDPENDEATNRYPSPSITTPSGSQSPVKFPNGLGEDDSEIRVNMSSDPAPAATDQPPRKKRKTNPPKPRTTEYLDLGNINEERKGGNDGMQLERLLLALRKKKKIVVIAGAGISVSAGIPDFRSSHGLFRSLKSQHKLKGSGKHLFDADVYRDNLSTQNFHTMVCELTSLSNAAEPTAFHHLLASLAEEGRLLRLYTQNVDGIDSKMKPLATKVPLNPKGPWPTTVQLHGGLEHMVCTKCGDLDTFDPELFKSYEPPLCPSCKNIEDVRINVAKKRSQGVGRLRPRIVLYNESNPDETAIGNVSMADLRARPDAVLVVGTSLKIPGVRRLVKELCLVTRGRRDGLTAWINLDPEPQGVEFKDAWDLVVKGKCDDVAELAQLPRWDEQEVGENAELSQEDEKTKELLLKRDRVEVQISPKLPELASPKRFDTKSDKIKAVEQVLGIPTPGASPQLSATQTPARIILKGAKSLQSKLPFAAKPASKAQGVLGRPRKELPAGRKPLPSEPTSQKRTRLPDEPTRNLPPRRRELLDPSKKTKKSTAKQDKVMSHQVTETFRMTKGAAPKLSPVPSKKKKRLSPVASLPVASPATPESDSSLSNPPSETSALVEVEADLPALAGLPDLRPKQRSTTSGVFRYTVDQSAGGANSSGSDLSDPPSTPTGPAPSEGTVSPGSIPNNMAHLIH